MTAQLPASTENDPRVVQFQPRTRTLVRHGISIDAGSPDDAGPIPQVPDDLSSNDLSRYEQHRSDSDDFRRRMLANGAALAVTMILMAIGLWLATTLADMRKTQDCVAMGLRDCAHIEALHN